MPNLKQKWISKELNANIAKNPEFGKETRHLIAIYECFKMNFM